MVPEASRLGGGQAELVDEALFLDEAVTIADDICDRCIEVKDGSVTWLGPTGYGTEENPLRIRQLGPHLNHGTTGVALFLAALAHVEGRAEHREICLRTIAPLRRRLAELAVDSSRAEQLQIRVGGLIGLGSFLYGFLKIAEWLEEPSLIREALDVAGLITPERIARDERVRIQTGSAGAILALLALHRRTPDAGRTGRTAVEIAKDCAQHLLEVQTEFEGLPKAWPLAPGKPPLAGFCYGAAGISHALLRLDEVAPAPELRRAAEEGLAFVRSLYSPEKGSWRDIRRRFQARFGDPVQSTWKDWWASNHSSPVSLLESRSGSAGDIGSEDQPSQDAFPAMWCHGSAGIALAKVDLLHLVGDEQVHEEIRRALAEVKSFADSDRVEKIRQDDICCGHMGSVEALHQAGRDLGDDELVAASRRLAWRVVMRAREKGRYEPSAARGTDAFSPALFQGMAGIGYTLLRLARPDDLPCLLLFQ